MASSINEKRLQPFLIIDIGGIRVGRISFNMHFDDAPLTCTKFLDLCTHKHGCGYRGSSFNLVVWDVCEASHHVMSDTGAQVECPPHLCTPSENLSARHERGVLTMGVWGDVTKSYFRILFEPCARWNGNSVIIGEVTPDTWQVVEKIRKVDGCPPSQEIKIVDCGVE